MTVQCDCSSAVHQSKRTEAQHEYHAVHTDSFRISLDHDNTNIK